mgnify:CR=1 FL=1
MGIPIKARPEDQYINATAMCKATGKRWAKYYENDSTHEFLDALAVQLRCPKSDLITTVIGKGKPQGTWVHRLVAMDFWGYTV